MKKAPSKHKKLKQVTLFLVIFLFSFSLISALVSTFIFSIMFARYDEAQSPLFLSYSDIDSAKYPREEKVFSSGKNKLTGYLYSSPEEACGVVVVVNGFHCTADRHLPEIMYFVDNGWAAFTFDNTGVGASEGENQVGLSQSGLDARAAIEYVSSITSKPIVLYGHSEGAYAAASSLEDETRVEAAVTVSGFNSPLELMHTHTKQVAGVLADIEYPFMFMHSYFLFNDYANLSAANAINNTKIPVAVFHGSGDTTVPYEISILSHKNEIKNPNAEYFEIKSAARGNHSTIWLSESAAEYTLAYKQNPDSNPDKEKANELDEDFMKYVLEFYNKAL